MKMSLWQRVIIQYYTYKLRLVGFFSIRKATIIAFNAFCTPFTMRMQKLRPAIFESSEPITIELYGLTIRGNRWKSPLLNPKKVLLLHGFGSCAYKFEGFVSPLINRGIEVVAFDAPAHGRSDGKRTHVLEYKEMILQAEQVFGNFYAFIAHSFGGLAAALALESLPNAENRKLILIAPLTETSAAVANFFAVIPASKEIIQDFEQYIFELTGNSYAFFSVARIIKTLSSSVLWVHDQDDKICSFQDIKALLNDNIPGTEFLVTNGLGHNKIYLDPQVQKHIVEYITLS